MSGDQWRRNEFESGGRGADPERSRHDQVFGRAPPLFGFKSTISRFGERFRDGRYSLVSLLFAPPCPAICKSGGTWPPFPMESALVTEVPQ